MLSRYQASCSLFNLFAEFSAEFCAEDDRKEDGVSRFLHKISVCHFLGEDIVS